MGLDWLINERKEHVDALRNKIQNAKLGRSRAEIVIGEPKAAGGKDVAWWKENGFVGVYMVRMPREDVQYGEF